jgi:hypothetical protein
MQPTPTVFNEGFSWYETLSKLIYQINLLIEDSNGNVSQIAELQAQKQSIVDYVNDITINRKLSSTGDFTGTWNGMTPSQSDIGVSALVLKHSDQIKNIATAILSDFETLQQAHDYITANHTHGLLLVDKDMVVTSTFYWDVKKVTLLGFGALLNFNINDTTKYAIETISSETVEPYYQATTYAQGIKFRGTDKNCNGIKFNGESTLSAPSHISLKNCEISYFNKGIDFANSAYGITFYDTDIFRNSIGINFDSGHTDCGEKLGFINCMIYNNATAIRNYADAWINFLNCSVDYNTECVLDINIGKLAFSNCHIEHRASWFGATNRPFKLSNEYTMLLITDSNLLFTSGNETTMDYVFENNSSGKGGIWIRDTYISGATTTTGWLATGNGYMEVSGTKTAVVEGTAPRVSSAMNLLKDGGFEGTSMQDEIFISSDTVAITSRTLTGTNAILSLDSTQHRSGVKSLKYTKTYGSGSNSGFTIQVPISKGSLIGYELFYKKVGTQSGTMNISHGWCKKGLDDVIFKKSEIASSNITFTSATVDWTENHSNTAGRPRCPSWATHFYIDFNMFSMYNGDLFFDDICITEM